MAVGNLSGPLRSGLSQRIADDTDARPDICFAEYVGNGSRLCNVPVIEPVGNGQTLVQVVGFARMFIVGVPTTIILVEAVGGPTPARGTSWGQTKVLYR
jgi:hypothetical protein